MKVLLFWVHFVLIFLWIWLQYQSGRKKNIPKYLTPDIFYVCETWITHSLSLQVKEGSPVQLMGESNSVGATKACRGLWGITTFYHACHHATHYLHGMIYCCCCCWHNLLFFFSPHAYPAQQHLLLFKEAYAFPHLDDPLLYLSGKELKRFCQKVALNQSCL